MIFADDIMAGVGGTSDIGGMIKSFASKLARAERFVLDRQVIEAAKQLAKSNPSSLVSALPLCRAPYATTWFEWTDATGNAGVRTGSDVIRVVEGCRSPSICPAGPTATSRSSCANTLVAEPVWSKN